ncbi:hypothetical protein BGX23_008781 [Mortierella sp. AD031]|nr:hypothetical protein BGX23_008781 [Mortierella sp. AD031]
MPDNPSPGVSSALASKSQVPDSATKVYEGAMEGLGCSTQDRFTDDIYRTRYGGVLRMLLGPQWPGVIEPQEPLTVLTITSIPQAATGACSSGEGRGNVGITANRKRKQPSPLHQEQPALAPYQTRAQSKILARQQSGREMSPPSRSRAASQQSTKQISRGRRGSPEIQGRQMNALQDSGFAMDDAFEEDDDLERDRDTRVDAGESFEYSNRPVQKRRKIELRSPAFQSGYKPREETPLPGDSDSTDQEHHTDEDYVSSTTYTSSELSSSFSTSSMDDDSDDDVYDGRSVPIPRSSAKAGLTRAARVDATTTSSRKSIGSNPCVDGRTGGGGVIATRTNPTHQSQGAIPGTVRPNTTTRSRKPRDVCVKTGRWTASEDRALYQGVVEYLAKNGLESLPPAHLPLKESFKEEVEERGYENERIKAVTPERSVGQHQNVGHEAAALAAVVRHEGGPRVDSQEKELSRDRANDAELFDELIDVPCGGFQDDGSRSHELYAEGSTSTLVGFKSVSVDRELLKENSIASSDGSQVEDNLVRTGKQRIHAPVAPTGTLDAPVRQFASFSGDVHEDTISGHSKGDHLNSEHYDQHIYQQQYQQQYQQHQQHIEYLRYLQQVRHPNETYRDQHHHASPQRQHHSTMPWPPSAELFGAPPVHFQAQRQDHAGEREGNDDPHLYQQQTPESLYAHRPQKHGIQHNNQQYYQHQHPQEISEESRQHHQYLQYLHRQQVSLKAAASEGIHHGHLQWTGAVDARGADQWPIHMQGMSTEGGTIAGDTSAASSTSRKGRNAGAKAWKRSKTSAVATEATTNGFLPGTQPVDDPKDILRNSNHSSPPLLSSSPTRTPLDPHQRNLTSQESYASAISRTMSLCPWSQIAAATVPGRTGVQAQARWSEALDPQVKKGPWSDQEDALLLEGVERSDKCWIWISDTISGRTQRQCRTRWVQLTINAERQAAIAALEEVRNGSFEGLVD